MSQFPFRFLHLESATHRPLVAISACLTGAAVRYDGTDKRQTGVDLWLRNEAELMPICPELEAGLGVPRPPVQLVATAGGTRALGRDDNALDVTAALVETARRYSARLHQLPVCGYLFKSRSPSCGLGSTPLFDSAGAQIGLDSGLQAKAMREALPWLPMEEESLLQHEESTRHFLFQCRLVFDCLHAGNVTARQVAEHYRPLWADQSLWGNADGPSNRMESDGRESDEKSEAARMATAVARNELHTVVALLIDRAGAVPAATLRRRMALQRAR